MTKLLAVGNQHQRTMPADGWATVIAVDPGGTSGWCALAVEADALACSDVSILASIVHNTIGQVAGDENEQADFLVELMYCWPSATRVIEDFTLRKFSRGRELLSPVRITARIEYGLAGSEWLRQDGLGGDDGWDGGPFPIVTTTDGTAQRMFYQPSELAKTTVTDARLRDWGLYTPGQEHARDALRHAITFLRRAKERPRLRALAWGSLYLPDGSLK